MANQMIDLHVKTRKAGRHDARALRRSQQVPGVVYGVKVKNTLLAAEEKLIKKYSTSQFENQIFTLRSNDQKELDGVPVLMKEVIVHPVTRRPTHVDLLAIDLTKTVRVFVELRFEGKAMGVAEGGLLQPLVREIEVDCLPTKIPQFISVDVTNLGVHQTLHLSDITLPEGVDAVSDGTLSLVTVTVVEEEAAPVAAAAPGAVAAAPAEPEVIKKGKKEEEGAAAAAPEKK